MASTSPSNVLTAYYNQFQKDFSLFLKCRAEELVEGGRMILTFLGRKSDNMFSKECCYIWELMAMALNDMVFQVEPKIAFYSFFRRFFLLKTLLYNILKLTEDPTRVIIFTALLYILCVGHIGSCNTPWILKKSKIHFCF